LNSIFTTAIQNGGNAPVLLIPHRVQPRSGGAGSSLHRQPIRVSTCSVLALSISEVAPTIAQRCKGRKEFSVHLNTGRDVCRTGSSIIAVKQHD
jgi:hypothetical protein